MKLCAVNGKRGYGDRHQARRSARKLQGRIRVYRCRDCGLYHVTTNTRGAA